MKGVQQNGHSQRNAALALKADRKNHIQPLALHLAEYQWFRQRRPHAAFPAVTRPRPRMWA